MALNNNFSKSLKINIINIIYGTFYKSIDVTDIVKHFFYKDNKLYISKDININNFFVDPCPGIYKKITINAVVNDNKIKITTQERFGKFVNDIVINVNSFLLNEPITHKNDIIDKSINTNKEGNEENDENIINVLDYFFVKNIDSIGVVVSEVNNIILPNSDADKINNIPINILHLHYVTNNKNNIEPMYFNKKIEQKYIKLIQKYFDKDIKIIIIGNDINETIIKYLKKNNYIYTTITNDVSYTQYNKWINILLTYKCNNTFIGNKIENNLLSKLTYTSNNNTTVIIDYDDKNLYENIIFRNYTV